MKRVYAFLFFILFVITCFSVYAYNNDNFTIVIDPGHGGYDPGCENNGIKEATINLEISYKLKDILTNNGYDCVMTRNKDNHLGGDKFIKKADLDERIRIINEGDLFISIHQNMFSNSIYHGAQVFYSNDNELLAKSIQESLLTLGNNNRQHKKIDNIYLLDNAKTKGCLVECGFMSNIEEFNKLMDENYQYELGYRIYDGICNYLKM